MKSEVLAHKAHLRPVPNRSAGGGGGGVGCTTASNEK